MSVFRPTSKAKHCRRFSANATCVGRANELERLKASVTGALTSGDGLMLLIEGAQGLGKSLLCETLVRDMQLVAAKGLPAYLFSIGTTLTGTYPRRNERRGE